MAYWGRQNEVKTEYDPLKWEIPEFVRGKISKNITSTDWLDLVYIMQSNNVNTFSQLARKIKNSQQGSSQEDFEQTYRLLRSDYDKLLDNFKLLQKESDKIEAENSQL